MKQDEDVGVEFKRGDRVLVQGKTLRGEAWVMEFYSATYLYNRGEEEVKRQWGDVVFPVATLLMCDDFTRTIASHRVEGNKLAEGILTLIKTEDFDGLTEHNKEVKRRKWEEEAASLREQFRAEHVFRSGAGGGGELRVQDNRVCDGCLQKGRALSFSASDSEYGSFQVARLCRACIDHLFAKPE